MMIVALSLGVTASSAGKSPRFNPLSKTGKDVLLEAYRDIKSGGGVLRATRTHDRIVFFEEGLDVTERIQVWTFPSSTGSDSAPGKDRFAMLTWSNGAFRLRYEENGKAELYEVIDRDTYDPYFLLKGRQGFHLASAARPDEKSPPFAKLPRDFDTSWLLEDYEGYRWMLLKAGDPRKRSIMFLDEPQVTRDGWMVDVLGDALTLPLEDPALAPEGVEDLVSSWLISTPYLPYKLVHKDDPTAVDTINKPPIGVGPLWGLVFESDMVLADPADPRRRSRAFAKGSLTDYGRYWKAATDGESILIDPDDPTSFSPPFNEIKSLGPDVFRLAQERDEVLTYRLVNKRRLTETTAPSVHGPMDMEGSYQMHNADGVPYLVQKNDVTKQSIPYTLHPESIGKSWLVRGLDEKYRLLAKDNVVVSSIASDDIPVFRFEESVVMKVGSYLHLVSTNDPNLRTQPFLRIVDPPDKGSDRTVIKKVLNRGKKVERILVEDPAGKTWWISTRDLTAQSADELTHNR